MDRLRQEFPQVRFVVAKGQAELAREITDADALLGRLPPELLAEAKQLRWIQSMGAGVERLLFPELVASKIVVTNAQGLYTPQISEHVLAMMLAFARDLPTVLAWQRAHTWKGGEVRPFCLEGQTLGVVGLGGIGGELARKAHCLGMRVIGLRRRPGSKPPYVDVLVGPDGLDTLLRESDHVAVCTPLTAETEGLIGERELRLMKPTAFIYNIGRGKIIQGKPLERALIEGWIAGAGLDVTDPEPLPPDSPLWDLPKVLITSHTSGTEPQNPERQYRLLAENLRRFLHGEPLRNMVDKQAGY